MNMFGSFEQRREPFPYFFSEGHSVPRAVADFCREVAPHGKLAQSTGSRADYASRVFLDRGSIDSYSPELRKFLAALDSSETRDEVEKRFDTDLSDCRLRIEIVGDVDGFFQIPHTDTADKKLTWLTYLGTVEENGDVGTSIYNSDKDFVTRVKWGFNNGLIFVPSDLSFHGYEENCRIKGVRKVLIINYVVGWNDEHELF